MSGSAGSHHRNAALRTALWALSCAAAAAVVAGLAYYWTLAQGQFARLTLADPLADLGFDSGLHFWVFGLLGVTLMSVAVQLLLVLAVRRRDKLFEQVSAESQRGRWGLVRLVSGARVWPELLSVVCLIAPAATVVVLEERARAAQLRLLGAVLGPGTGTALLADVVTTQRDILRVGIPLVLLSTSVALVILPLLAMPRVRVAALAKAAQALRQGASEEGHPYRTRLRADAVAGAWVTIPGPRAGSTVVWSLAAIGLVVAPAAVGLVRFAYELLSEPGQSELSRAGWARGSLQHLELSESWFALWCRISLAGLGLLGLLTLAAWIWRARLRHRIAPTLPRWPCPSWGKTLAVAGTAAVLCIAAGRTLYRYRAESLMPLRVDHKAVRSPPGVLPVDFPHVTAFDPVVTIEREGYAVDGKPVPDAASLARVLESYKATYPAWAARQERFVVVTSSQRPSVAQADAALSAARDAGYARVALAVQGFCDEQHRPVLGELRFCSLITKVASAADGWSSDWDPWDVPEIGWWTGTIMHARR